MIKDITASLLRGFLSFLYPEICSYCNDERASEHVLCDSCRQIVGKRLAGESLLLLKSSDCSCPGLTCVSPAGEIPFPALSEDPALNAVFSLLPYSGEWKALVRECKFRNDLGTAEWLGHLLAENCEKLDQSDKLFQSDKPNQSDKLYQSDNLYQIDKTGRTARDNAAGSADPDKSVPCRKKLLREAVLITPPSAEYEGEALCRVLAQAVSDLTGTCCHGDLFLKKDRTRQRELKKCDRLKKPWNSIFFKDSKRAADIVKARNVILIDDIVTTGATLQRTAALLKEAGASGVTALTAAYTPQKEDALHKGNAFQKGNTP